MFSVRAFSIFLLKRVLATLLVLVGVMVIIFLISHVLSHDPARLWAGPRAKPSTVQAVEIRYHLNQPLEEQFIYFITSYLSGHFGIDPVTGRSIAAEIGYYLPNTLELVFAALAMILVFGVGLGYLGAMNFGKRIDTVIRVFYLTSWATPTFLGAILAVLLFSTYLHVFPSGGMYSPTLVPPPRITGIFVLDSLLGGRLQDLSSGLYHLALPAFTLAFLNFGLITRIARSSMLDARWATHVKGALAKGVPENTVRRRHVLRNALIDVDTVGAVMFGWLISGTVVVEQIFAWPGIGQFAYSAVASDNYPALVPIVMVFTLGVVVANFVADVLYSILDPRIALGGAR